MKRKKTAISAVSFSDWLDQRRTTLDEVRKLWPTFELEDRIFFDEPIHLPPFILENRVYHHSQIGFWGMFVRHYTDGSGSMTVSKITKLDGLMFP